MLKGLNSLFSFLFLTHSLIASFFFYKKNVKPLPWVYGLINNMLYSYSRYSPKERLNKFKNIINNPFIGWQYFCILNNKQDVTFVGIMDIEIENLIPQHPVNECFLLRKMADINFSENNGIIVDNIIHDGHHRINIAKRLGIKTLKLEVYKTKV